jgi:hypothetical protein
MSFEYKAGLNHVGNYQVSGIPFVTGNLTLPLTSSAPLRIDFPSVTSYFEFHNHGAYHARLAFSANGLKGSNYYSVEPSGSVQIRVKATSIFLASNHPTNTLAGCSLIASLTGITGYDLTSALTGAAGIG